MKWVARLLLRVCLVLFLSINVVVAFHAYKFTHYYNPGEVVIKKQDEKTSWDKTKEILFGFNFVKNPNKSTVSDFNTVYLKTSNGLKLEAWLIEVENPKGTVALFHGYKGSKTGISNEASAFRKLGYNTIVLDFRAHGNSEGNTCTFGYKEAEDVRLVYDYLKEKGEQNIFLYGISMGAATITKAINDYGLSPSRIILDMPFGTISSAVKGRIKMMNLPVEPLATLLIFWGGTEHGFWAYGIKPSEYVKKIKCPVLLQVGKNDPRVSFEETNDIYTNIPAQKKLVVYENSGHESLCNKENNKWLSEITAFLQ